MICSPVFGGLIFASCAARTNSNAKPMSLTGTVVLQQCIKTEESTSPIYFIWGSTNSVQYIIRYLEKIEYCCHIHAIFLPLSRLACEAAILQPKGDRLQAVLREYSHTHKALPPRRLISLNVLVLNCHGF